MISTNNNQSINKSPLTCIDLFCGCGGFTLGLQRAGYHVLAAIDFNKEAIEVFRTNLMEQKHPDLIPVSFALNEDLTTYSPEDLSKVIGKTHVDLIVGGPPCQGFSTARQVDGSNHGDRIKFDSRRYLYRDYLRFVKFYQPRIFVMENVPGIRSAGGGDYFTNLQNESRNLGRNEGLPGYRVQTQIEDAWALGVPQKRRRQLIIGVRNDIPGYFPTELKPAPRAIPHIKLGPTIGDLPNLDAGKGINDNYYDRDKRKNHIKKYGESATSYLSNVLEIDSVNKLKNHVARPHSNRDLRDFKKLKEGENCHTAMRTRNVEFEFPYDKTRFKDRYTRQSNMGPCSTIVAHLSKDGLMFIHPTQNRSITPREAARIQSFPDWFVFPEARTHSFRLIGNAVPPLVGEALGLCAINFMNQDNSQKHLLKKTINQKPLPGFFDFPDNDDLFEENIPKSFPNAIYYLEYFSKLSKNDLTVLPNIEFLKIWNSFLYLFPSLHPCNALDHGTKIESLANSGMYANSKKPIFQKRYLRSGWPIELVAIGMEAWRRTKTGEFTYDCLYNSYAQKAGMVGVYGIPA